MKLIIKLKSDLCVASGDGFASTVDTDVVYDRYGLPFIPGRRLKGCLRDAALEFLDYESNKNEIDGIFGISGDDKSGSLHISNAVINGYTEAVDYLKIKGTEPQKILSMFTYTRAQTAIDKDGHAKEGSLRFTRVVNHYWNGKEGQFEADIQLDSRYEELFEKICMALRNIGFNRNRGLGAIECSVKKAENVKLLSYNQEFKPDVRYSLDYSVYLETPLMLPATSGNISCDFISGTSVMGYFASKLKDNPAFEDLFLKNNIKFSNLYPVDENGGKCIPAPSIIGKNKLAKEPENTYVSFFDSRIMQKNTENSVVLKPLKSGYVNSNFIPFSVDTEIIYHHSSKEEKILYTQNCLCAGQKFYGSITADGRYMQEILSVMQSGKMSLGRSKTAQYSVCRVTDDMNIREYSEEKVNVGKNEICAYILTSDIILCTENATYSATCEDLKNALGIKGELLPQTALNYITLSGYNAKWNQKKPHIRAIAKGSCVVFEAEDSVYNREKYIGEKQEEGFGKAVFYKISETFPKYEKTENTVVSADAPELLKNITKEEKTAESVKKAALDFALENSRLFTKELNPAFIGRVLNMVEQASDLNDLNIRIASVKSKEKLNTVTEIAKTQFDSWADSREYLLTVFTVGKYIARRGGEKNA